jgi:hypothetical protein
MSGRKQNLFKKKWLHEFKHNHYFLSTFKKAMATQAGNKYCTAKQQVFLCYW